MTQALTADEVLRLPATTDLETAASAFGIGRTTAYDLARRNEFPCRVIRAGRVLRVAERSLVVEFPRAGQTLTFSAGADALVPLAFAPGTTALLDGAKVTVARAGDAGTVFLSDGRSVGINALEPLSADRVQLVGGLRAAVDILLETACCTPAGSAERTDPTSSHLGPRPRKPRREIGAAIPEGGGAPLR